MKIVQTPVRFYPYIGGVESYVRDVSKKLVSLGHDVEVICAKSSEKSNSVEQVDGIEVSRLRSAGKIAQTNITPSLPIAILNSIQSADIVHTHIPTPWSADISALSATLSDTPCVVTYHNDIVGDGIADGIAKLYNKTILKLTLSAVDKILITQPKYLEHSPHLGEFEHKVEVVPNGVDTKKFQPQKTNKETAASLGFADDRPNLFFLSVLDKFHRYKGLDVLLKSIALFDSSNHTTPNLVVGGSGELESEYKSLSQELGISDYVHFTGYIPEESVCQAYNAADLFVLPSLSSDQEGFGLVALESLACGTPVVTTDVVGVADDIVRNRVGSIAEVGSAESLFQTIQDELECNTNSKSQRARKLCSSKYSWKQSVEQLEDVYHSAYNGYK